MIFCMLWDQDSKQTERQVHQQVAACAENADLVVGRVFRGRSNLLAAAWLQQQRRVHGRHLRQRQRVGPAAFPASHQLQPRLLLSSHSEGLQTPLSLHSLILSGCVILCICMAYLSLPVLEWALHGWQVGRACTARMEAGMHATKERHIWSI